MSYQEERLAAIADAIRQMDGTSAPIVANEFPDRIRAIRTGVDISDATATAADILSPKTAYVKDGKVTGTITTRSSSSVTSSGATVSIPAGYYPSAVTKSITTATRASPSISVSSSGLITASVTQGAGYVSSGTNRSTYQLSTQSGYTLTPTTYQQTAVSSGRYTTGAIYVAGSSNLVSSNIRSGVNIFGVYGNYSASLSTYSINISASNVARADIFHDNNNGVISITIVGYQMGITSAYIYPPVSGVIAIIKTGVNVPYSNGCFSISTNMHNGQSSVHIGSASNSGTITLEN